ncbi:MAG TPA: Ada metal-binding domain-containing protein [Gemmatimonadales bacterium]|nr:Ada metal-binding domain-containing protein [Gemmatimonadales bacterium]
MVSAVAPGGGRAEPIHRDAYQLAVDARDPRFDGVFFVGITTTRVYCRPCCPSRLAYDRHRRFFDSAAAAERAGFRPCLRCRPELAPGRTSLAAVSRLAHVAAQRIAAGALNGRSVADLAADLGVSERHLRRALEREVSVSPLELAQTHRLLLAKRLIVDTDLPMTRVAYSSGFQSLRRFNVVFREQYRMPPSALRRGRRTPARETASLRLTLSYRAPLDWDALVAGAGREATVSIDGHSGRVCVENSPADAYLVVEIAESLLPVLMPLIAGLRRVFDVDAEPAVIDAHLAAQGLADLVARHPGVRLPGVLERLEGALPDAFPGSDRRLQRAAGVTGARALLARAEQWRPWRAYAAQLLGTLSARPSSP